MHMNAGFTATLVLILVCVIGFQLCDARHQPRQVISRRRAQPLSWKLAHLRFVEDIRGGAQNRVLDVHTRTELQTILKKAKASKQLVVIDFAASWCGPCQKIAPIFKELSSRPEFTKVVFVKVDVDGAPELTSDYGVKAMPTFIFWKHGKIIDSQQGADAQNLVHMLEEHL